MISGPRHVRQRDIKKPRLDGANPSGAIFATAGVAAVKNIASRSCVNHPNENKFKGADSLPLTAVNLPNPPLGFSSSKPPS